MGLARGPLTLGVYSPLFMGTMTADIETNRYIFKTQGVCPPEIHFKISRGVLSDIRFVGGGCPGNAYLVSQLLNGREASDVLQLLSGIACRNGTSCPDQLACAIDAVKTGHLSSAASFRVVDDPLPKLRMGLIGELDGDAAVLNHVAAAVSSAGVEGVICLGNLTGASTSNRETLKALRKLNIHAIQGANDWNYANAKEQPDFPPLDLQERDWLLRLPHVRTFRLGGKPCMAFFGDFIQTLPGYSDYDPYALEMNMVSGLTNFMQDETVVPALEAMTPQFLADVILFSQPRKWGHWCAGGKDFIGIGPAAEGDSVSWGLLESLDGKIQFNRIRTGR
jgi:uncharacterized protein (TIGR03905 family)